LNIFSLFSFFFIGRSADKWHGEKALYYFEKKSGCAQRMFKRL